MEEEWKDKRTEPQSLRATDAGQTRRESTAHHQTIRSANSPAQGGLLQDSVSQWKA